MDFDYQQIIDNLGEGLYFTDQSRRILYWNKSAERITGFTADEVMGRSCSENFLTHVDESGNPLCGGACPLAMPMRTNQPYEAEIFLHHKDGHRVPVFVRTALLKDKKGDMVGVSQLFSDISVKASLEERVKDLERLAMLDALTQLANRRFAEREINNRIAESERYGSPFGILFIDIDHFKQFNDTYGHEVGDQVLKSVAGTFSANSRQFDIYARWGGEEFVGIFRNVDRNSLEKLGEKIRVLVESSYLVKEGKRLKVTISIGATIMMPGDTKDSLVDRADKMLYCSKEHGRNMLTMG